MFDRVVNLTKEDEQKIKEEVVSTVKTWLKSPYYTEHVAVVLIDDDRFVRLLIERINNVQLKGGR